MSGPLKPILARPEDLAAKAMPAQGRTAAELHKTAAAFEGMLVSTMLQGMRKTVHPSGLLGDSGQARGTLDYLLDQAIVDSAIKGGKTWGLARRLEEAWMSKGTAKKPEPSNQSVQVVRPRADKPDVEVLHADKQ